MPAMFLTKPQKKAARSIEYEAVQQMAPGLGDGIHDRSCCTGLQQKNGLPGRIQSESATEKQEEASERFDA